MLKRVNNAVATIMMIEFPYLLLPVLLPFLLLLIPGSEVLKDLVLSTCQVVGLLHLKHRLTLT